MADRRSGGTSVASIEKTIADVVAVAVPSSTDTPAIAGTPGVDGLFIGPGDLSLRLGCPLDWKNPKMVAAEDAVAAAAARHGIAWGRPSGTAEDITALAKKGGRLIAHGSDFGAVMKMMPVFGQTMSDGLGAL